MRKYGSYGVLALAASLVGTAQGIDWTKPPEPLPVKAFRFPAYTETELPNGLKIFLIEDHEQPTVTLRLQINAGDAQDDIPGTAAMTAMMLTKGAGKRTAQQIAAAIDSVGATLEASSAGDFSAVVATTLKKHLPFVLEIFADVVLRPTFPEGELEKLRPQVIAEIQQERARPASLAQALARRVVYGPNHPYARRRTEESVAKIRVRDLREFYDRFYRPQNATLAVVGDITERELLPLLRRAFGGWKRREVSLAPFPPPQPMPNGIYFIARPGSVQSSLVVSAVTVPYTHPDHEVIEVLSELLGSAFGGRLFRSLRETYAYTYAPFAFQTEARYINRIALGADVRTAVTDSALLVIQREVERLMQEAPSQEELERIKQAMVGAYLRSFERPEFIATLLQRAELYGMPKERLQHYPERLLSIIPWQIREVAERYLQPVALRTVVVGAPEVLPRLQALGKVYEYTAELQPASAYQPVDLSAAELLQRYVAAVGGAEALGKLQALLVQAKVGLRVRDLSVEGELVRKWKAPDRSVELLKTPFFQQQTWSDGRSVRVELNGVPHDVSDREREKVLLQAHPFYVAFLLDRGFRCTVLGKRGDHIVLKAEPPYGGEHLYYFNATSYLLERAEKTEPTAQGDQAITELYGDYLELKGLRFPKRITVQTPWGSLQMENAYQLNPPLEESEFQPSPQR